jgi:glc operon protein GlcG
MVTSQTTSAVAAISTQAASAPLASFAQSLPYGAPISVADAKSAAAAAVLEMQKLHLEMTIAIVDSGNNLVYLERSDQAGIGTIDAAIGKAKAANGIKAPTKMIQDAILLQNQINLLAVPGAFPVEGGVPLVIDGKVVGAIVASGGMPPDDGAVATVGATSLQP